MARPPTARPIREHREVIARTIRQVALNRRLPLPKRKKMVGHLTDALKCLGAPR